MDPRIAWLTILGAALITISALIGFVRGDGRGIPWLELIVVALIGVGALVGMALAEPPLPARP